MEKVLNQLFRPVSASVVATFRILFGFILFLECMYYWRIGFVPYGLTRPVFHLKYDYFEWVEPLPEPIMYGILALMTLCALCICVGYFYRWAVALFGVSFVYFMLIEQSHYNNHFYLFALLFMVMFFIPADKMYSVRARMKPTDAKISFWNHAIMTFLIFVTYFYGGIAKMSPEWLGGGVPRAIVEGLPDSNIMVGLLGREGFSAFLRYGGLVFDLLIGFALLWKPTRWLAVVGVLIFNITNGSVLFSDIGYFPFFMICATILFFEPDFVEKLFPKEKQSNKRKSKKAKNAEPVRAVAEVEDYTPKMMTAIVLGVFVLVQLLLPLRSYVMKGIPEWEGERMRFSWRMKMQTKKNEKVTLKFKDIITKQEIELPITQHLTGHQLQHIADDPNYLVQLAKYFKRTVKGRDMSNVVVLGDVRTSFNSRKVQQMIKPGIDLSQINPRDHNSDWIMPLE